MRDTVHQILSALARAVIGTIKLTGNGTALLAVSPEANDVVCPVVEKVDPFAE